MPNRNCFVVMPFGEKIDANGASIKFDDVYNYIIKPAVTTQLGLECIRGDGVRSAAPIHRDLFTRIAFCDVLIADVSMGNPNVFYELGVRHALRKNVTVLVKHKDSPLPFNIRGMRVIDYGLYAAEVDRAKSEIEEFVKAGLAEEANDSLVFDLLPSLASFADREIMAAFDKGGLIPLLLQVLEALPQHRTYWKILNILDDLGKLLGQRVLFEDQPSRLDRAIKHYESMASVKNLPDGKLFTLYEELMDLYSLAENPEKSASYGRMLESLEQSA
jgi:hypothetical protein